MNPVVESLRVLGALMVVTHHYTYQLSPELARQWSELHFFHNGVDLFFVITGYLFAPFLLAEKSLVARKFLKRRFFRLYPLYLLSMVTLILSGTIALPSLNLLLEHVLLIQNLPLNSLAEAGAISLVYWTLAVEFQFYILVLLLALVYRYVGINHKIWVLLLFSVLGFVISAYLNYAPKSENWVLWQAQLPALLLEFWFGIFVYRYWSCWQGTLRSSLVLAAAILILCLLYLYYPLLMEESLSARPFAWFNVASALGYAGILAGLLGWHAQTKLKCPQMVKLAIFCGGLSYPVYLFHEVVIRWLQTNTLLTVQTDNEIRVFQAVVITIVLAALINRWVEIPCREYGRR